MEFIKNMKKREFIEMGLKTLAAILAAFLAVILMEGMIYSIKLNALKTKGNGHSSMTDSTIAYCIKESPSSDKYFVIYYNKANGISIQKDDEWSSTKTARYTLAELKEDSFTNSVKKVVMHAPSAFDFSITPIHYVVIGLFMGAVAAFFIVKFVLLSKQYKKIEENFIKTGTIEIG